MTGNDSDGWVKLWRKLRRSEVMSLSPLHLKVFVWILLNACHEPVTIRKHNLRLEPGELTTTYAAIAKGCSWVEKRIYHQPSVQQLRTVISNLCLLEVLEQRHTQQQGYLHLKVLHWDLYQGDDDVQQQTQQQDSNRTATGQQQQTKNEKNEKKERERSSSPSLAPSVREVFDHWRMRLEKPRTHLTDDRRRKIEARLKEGYSPGQLKKAIDGLLLSDWHMDPERNESARDVTNIFKSAVQTDSFLARVPELAPRNGGPVVIDPEFVDIWREDD